MNENTIVFGTNGIRGRVGQHPFTDDALRRIGVAIGMWACGKFSKRPKILIGCDTRISASSVKKSLSDGLCTSPVTLVDAGVVPTPAVCQLIQFEEGFDLGLMISASHNPYHDNGIKLFGVDKCVFGDREELEIVQLYNDLYEGQKEPAIDRKCDVVDWSEASQVYENNMVKFFPENFLEGKKIVLDCAHGATAHIAPCLFERFGATVISLAVSPDGKNINDGCGALHPERLQREVVAQKADAGFAFDGDGDRIVGVDQQGELKEGDDILSLLLKHPKYSDVKTVVGTVMTNYGFELALNNDEKELVRTPVGDKYISAIMDAQRLPLGGELSGHIIISEYLLSGDGMFVALKALESMQVCNNWEMDSFVKVPQVLINIPVSSKKDLAQAPCSDIISEHKADLSDGRILVRYSGTENVLRIMTEGKEESKARCVARSLADELRVVLNE